MVTTVAEPTTRVGRGWALRFNLAWVGVMVGFFGPLQILLPNQAEAISPDHKELVLGLVTALGATCSLVLNPLWGALSDRTTSSWGRRLPWVVAGGLAGALSLLVVASARTVLMMVLGWCLVQCTLNAAWAALTAVVPDQVPREQRGAAAGYLGLSQMLGVLLAIAVATLVPGTGGYLACAALLLLSLVPFVLARADVPRAAGAVPVPRWSRRELVRTFWVSPRRHPDFAWAWLTRFLINLGNAIALVYLLYFLRDELHRSNAEAGVLVLGAVNVLGVVLAVVVSGIWSDRLARRKSFVSAAGMVMALAGLLLAISPTWETALVAAFVLGVGFGVYTSVDFALITEVLPEAADRGKDMGVLNIAAALPQVAAPAIAAVVVTYLGGYPALFAVSAAIGALGALLVHCITSVH
ncbi:MFS transporter [Luteipulveratus flavus]|uniref:MFS transporter n=1 Tax=Luteipulveratus flavus TaxID=3031728 RepID=UPI003907FA59